MPKKAKHPKSKSKDSQLIIRINKEDRDEFVQICELLDTSAAREIRRFVREFLEKNRE